MKHKSGWKVSWKFERAKQENKGLNKTKFEQVFWKTQQEQEQK